MRNVLVNDPDVFADRPAPAIAIEAFCELEGTRRLIASCAGDRRLARAKVGVFEGGLAAAIERFHDRAAPDLVIVETGMRGRGLFDQLDELVRVCDSDTKLVVIGAINDPGLGRALLERGVSAYIALPFTPVALMRTIAALYVDPDAPGHGRTLAVVGAKTGVGASTIARDIARCVVEAHGLEAAIVDVERGLVRRVGRSRSVRGFRRNLRACSAAMDALRREAALVILDVPYRRLSWAGPLVGEADDVIVAAAADLESLHNAKDLYDRLRVARPHDPPAKLALNQIGRRRRPEIPAASFAEILGVEPAAALPFDPAAAEGDAKILDGLAGLAAALIGRAPPARRRTLMQRMLRRA